MLRKTSAVNAVVMLVQAELEQAKEEVIKMIVNQDVVELLLQTTKGYQGDKSRRIMLLQKQNHSEKIERDRERAS